MFRSAAARLKTLAVLTAVGTVTSAASPSRRAATGLRREGVAQVDGVRSAARWRTRRRPWTRRRRREDDHDRPEAGGDTERQGRTGRGPQGPPAAGGEGEHEGSEGEAGESGTES